MEFLIILGGVWYFWGHYFALSFSLFATVVHGWEELEGWRGRREWWWFAAAQASFVALAILGLAVGFVWALWLLVAFRVIDGVGFHLLFRPHWPGRDTLLLTLADATLLTLFLATR